MVRLARGIRYQATLSSIDAIPYYLAMTCQSIKWTPCFICVEFKSSSGSELLCSSLGGVDPLSVKFRICGGWTLGQQRQEQFELIMKKCTERIVRTINGY